jgi:hypothetical protein
MIEDDVSFLDLGLRSKAVVSITDQINAMLSVDLPVTKMFESPTVNLLAADISATSDAQTSQIREVIRGRLLKQMCNHETRTEIAQATVGETPPTCFRRGSD